MLTHVVKTPLLNGCPELCLQKISWQQRLSELEFYFPLSRASKKSFVQLLAGHGVDDRVGQRLSFLEIEGFLKGFVDLVFEYDGRYYLADWKSNYLGRRADDYGRESLANVMAEETYILQYLLYTVALHQYLGTRIPDYHYGRYFGGVFYLFLRGIHPDLGPEYGIYHDVPSADLIYEMSRLLVNSKKALVE
jgi:exodeoxyribonuclease V beta subunit